MSTTPTTGEIEFGMVVHDADACAAFYSRTLGFEEFRRVVLVEEITGPAGMGRPGSLIWLRAPDGSTVKFFDGGEGSEYRPPAAGSGRDHFLSVYVQDLDAALDAVVQGGGEPMSDPLTLPTGVRLVFFRDVGGHAVEMVQRPEVAG